MTPKRFHNKTVEQLEAEGALVFIMAPEDFEGFSSPEEAASARSHVLDGAGEYAQDLLDQALEVDQESNQ